MSSGSWSLACEKVGNTASFVCLAATRCIQKLHAPAQTQSRSPPAPCAPRTYLDRPLSPGDFRASAALGLLVSCRVSGAVASSASSWDNSSSEVSARKSAMTLRVFRPLLGRRGSSSSSSSSELGARSEARGPSGLATLPRLARGWLLGVTPAGLAPVAGLGAPPFPEPPRDDPETRVADWVRPAVSIDAPGSAPGTRARAPLPVFGRLSGGWKRSTYPGATSSTQKSLGSWDAGRTPVCSRNERTGEGRWAVGSRMLNMLHSAHLQNKTSTGSRGNAPC